MRRLLFLLLACVVATTACGGERPSFDESAAREVAPSVADDADSLGDAEAPVVVRLAVAPGWSADPGDAGPASLSTRIVADLLYEGLTRLDADGAPEAALAERWFVSEDRLTWTFVLPDELVDGDGAPLTARHVKRSLERVAARGPNDQAAATLSSVTGWTDRMQGVTGGVAGIAAPDDTTLVLTLESPFEQLLDVLAAPAYGITVEGDDGVLRTTGAYRRSDDPARFTAVDPMAPADVVALVDDPAGPVAAVASGDADWAVLGADDTAVDLPADIVRQPLDIQVGVVARLRDRSERLGVLAALDPLALADQVDGIEGRLAPDAADSGGLPGAALVEVPTGSLEPLAAAVADQLSAAGVDVLPVAGSVEEFAARVESGEGLIFPVVIAGGIGPDLALLSLATPGGPDDVFGPDSEARRELSTAIRAEIDVERRAVLATALQQSLIDDGFLLPVGTYEVRVAMGHRLEGLRHRSDGTLDLSDVQLAS